MVHNGLESIYRLHRSGLLAVALSITRSSSDAEDAIHDAFARLCRNSQPAGADPVAYAFVAVRNAAVDRLRRRRGDEPLSMEFQAAIQAVSNGLATGERDRAVAAAIDELPIEQRSALLLRVFCNLTFRQIAEIENAPLQTVVSRYQSALARLKPKLKEWS